TSNYILAKMTYEALDFAMVLKEAQAQGYAEADPTFDIEGLDSAHKLQILVTIAFRTFIDLKHIHTEGITRVTAQDIAYARDLGYRINLPAVGAGALPLRSIDTVRCCYYLRVMAQDRPGVLSRVAGILGQHDISIASVLQRERAANEAVPIVMMTHEAREHDMRRALAAIDRLPDVGTATTMIRVEGGPA